jgi:hypothetical protein
MAIASTSSQALPAPLSGYQWDLPNSSMTLKSTTPVISSKSYWISSLSQPIGLEVSEMKAMLFYFIDQVSPPERIIRTGEKMFTQFHFHLQKYDTHRICNCMVPRKSANSPEP